MKNVIITDEGYGCVFQRHKFFTVIQSHEFLWSKAFSLKLLQQLTYIVDMAKIYSWEETGAKILKHQATSLKPNPLKCHVDI